MNASELQAALGNIDLYLLDQLLKNRFEGKNKLLDVGCGEGRNLHYFAKNGYELHGIDTDPMAVKMCRMQFKGHEFQQANADNLPFPDQSFDVVICSAVLHFAIDREHFFKQFYELLRVLNPNGILFIRMASSIGIDHPPDDAFSYLLSSDDLKEIGERVSFIEPFKTVVVDNQRSMATLVLSKKFF